MLALLLSSAAAAAHDDPSKTYNYLAIGDWGNDSPGQYAAAAGMGTVAAEIKATQVFALGDNCKTVQQLPLRLLPEPQ